MPCTSEEQVPAAFSIFDEPEKEATTRVTRNLPEPGV